MRSVMLAAVLVSTSFAMRVSAQVRDSSMDRSSYTGVWKSAAPDAFRPGEPVWLLLGTDVDPNLQFQLLIESVRPHRGSDRHCTLYLFSRDNLLTTCSTESATVVGLYDAESQRKLDELSVPGKPVWGAAMVRLMSPTRWNLRVEGPPRGASTRRDATYYAEVNGKLARIATFDAGYQSLTAERELSPAEILYLVREGFAFDAEHLGFVKGTDTNRDGVNERIELTTRKFTRTNDTIVLLKAPRVTRTMRWNPKTHTYED